jgi:hypothetical protein
MTFLAAGVNKRVPLDPYNGDFVRAGASFAERKPTMRRGIDISDITFGKDAIRWPGGDVSGGAIKLSGVQASTSYANDAAAAAGGVGVGQVYRNGSVVQVRIV